MNKISKIIWSLFSGVACLVYGNNAKAAAGDCTVVSWSNTAQNTPSNEAARTNCKASFPPKCYHLEGAATYCFYSCDICDAGYTRYSVDVSVLTYNCKNISVQAYNCKCECSNCSDTASWTNKGTGYQQRTKKTCSCSTGSAVCSTSTVYRCAVGYYGTTTNGTSGCTQCPTPSESSAGASSTSNAGNNSSISRCYIPESTSYSDGTGKYAFECNCPWDGKNSCGSSSSSSAA